MASTLAANRKKLDEYHLKVLRELLTLPANKYCFDCNQRGPTYVNVTIGSFVCTKCSGMLRGLTPPHRVKSVTMATFTPEEVEFIKSRGNEYCRKVWLGLHDSEIPTKDEQQIKDFMISKYEKKRFYLDPATVNVMNGRKTPSSLSSCSSSSHNSPSSHNLSSDTSSGKLLSQPISQSQQHTKQSSPFSTQNGSATNIFTADFSSPSSASDPFGSSLDSSLSSEASFANFDNNPLFSPPAQNITANGHEAKEVAPPSEDKYAALKDLDCLMKSQMQQEQQQHSAHVFHHPTVNGAPAVVNGIAADWNNGQVWNNAFPALSNGAVSEPVTPFNPFASSPAQYVLQKPYEVNPFHATKSDAWCNGNGTDMWKSSESLFGHSQSVPFSNGWGSSPGNPFKMNGVWPQANGHHHSSNPFL